MTMEGLKKRQLLRIVSDPECLKCFGSGLHISSEHKKYENLIRIEVVVCGCVKVVRQLPKKAKVDGVQR